MARPFRVIVTPQAQRDLVELDRYLLDCTEAAADQFLDRVLVAIGDLDRFPTRHPIARESRRRRELRQLVVGDYRILFRISGATVHVLRIGHGARRSLPPP